jgi:hypothetical protein
MEREKQRSHMAKDRRVTILFSADEGKLFVTYC